jgi:hypothetical protein
MGLPPKLAAIAASQGGPFTAAQAIAAGFDVREIQRFVRRGLWVRLRRGVYIETALVPDDEAARHILDLRAVLLCLRAEVAASHITSAALHGGALLNPDFSLVNVARECAGTSRTEAGVRHHDASLPSSHLTKIDGILTTAAARMAVDLARELPYESALVAAESVLNKGMTTLTELREVLAYCADWMGARDAARVVSFASPYSESPGETLTRIAFDVLGLPQPEQQVLIYDHAGLIGRVDFYIEEHHTVGEFDGLVKYSGEDGKQVLIDEKRREDRLRQAGVQVFRVEWAESCAKSPSIRRKMLAAFERNQYSNIQPTYRIKRQPPPR